MKILIAYDGSEHADAALADLRRAGLPPEAEVIVFSVAELTTPMPPLHAGSALAYAQALPPGQEVAAEVARQGVERIRQDFPGWQARAETAAGSPAWVIVQRADEWRPDLVVVGSQGRSALGRAIFGSVSQQIVNEVRCSVRVGRALVGEAAPAPRLLLCLDGSEYASAALRAVAERDWPVGTETRLLTVVGPFSDMTVPEFQLDMARAEAIQGMAIPILDGKGLKLTTAAKDGDPKRVILEQAEEWKADCIFMGSRGLNRFHRFWLGSVSTAAVARASCSVEIVRVREQEENS
jgi:nucleotide-binding universal stress UspA family protein